MAETIRKGIWQTGYESGEVKGKVEGKIKSILTVLHTRFKQVPLPVAESICKKSDPTALRTILSDAITCDSIEEFSKSVG